MEVNKLLVTGASGFVGSRLAEVLRESGFAVLGTARTQHNKDIVAMPLDSQDWTPVLDGVDTVVHCAALAHIPMSTDEGFIDDVKKLNVESAVRLAKQAKEKGAKRFIFLSSVKALGETTIFGQLYTHDSDYCPADLYGKSKRDAELALKEELSDSDTELVIIRPPLVYGPGVKGNFKSLMRVANRNLPLPFKTVDNKRSLVALDNLIDLIVTCIKHPEPLNDTFLVSDGQDISIKQLLEALTQAYGKQPRLIPFPVSVMRTAAGLLGKKSVADRLFGNLQLDINHTKQTLNWQPKVSFEQAIRDCVEAESDINNQTKG